MFGLPLVLASRVYKGLMDKARQAQASGQVKVALPKVLGHLSRLSTFLNQDEIGVAGACLASLFPMAAMLQRPDSHYTSSLSRGFSPMSECSGAVRLASTCVWQLRLASPRVGQLWQGHELHLVMYILLHKKAVRLASPCVGQLRLASPGVRQLWHGNEVSITL